MTYLPETQLTCLVPGFGGIIDTSLWNHNQTYDKWYAVQVTLTTMMVMMKDNAGKLSLYAAMTLDGKVDRNNI